MGIDYLPGPNYIRVRGRPNAEAGGHCSTAAGCGSGPGGHTRTHEGQSETNAYQDLVEGLTPFPGNDSGLPGSDDGGGSGFP